MNEKNSLNTYKRLLSYLKNYKAMFAIAIAGSLLYSLMEMFFIMSLKPLTDKGLVGGDIEFMKMVPYYIVGIVFLRGLGGFISTYSMAWIGQRVVQKMRQQLIDSYIYLPASFYDSESSGQLVSKVTFNTQQVAATATDAITKLLREGIFIIGMVSFLFYTNWFLALIFFVSAPVIGLIVRFASKRFKVISQRIQSAMGDVTQTSQEIIDGYKVIKTFSGENYESKRFHFAANSNRRQTMKMITTKAVSTPLIQFIASFSVATVIFFAAQLLEEKSLTPGEFITMLSGMIALLSPLKVISDLNSIIQQGLAAADSVFEIIDTPRENNKGQFKLSSTPETIQFNGISFSYPSSKDKVIDDISFSVNHGTTVALVGRSGSGKSTLTSLLLRFYELDSGDIQIDNKDIRQYELPSLRQNIAYVSQHVTLFDDSVKANIAYAQESIDQERLIEAATKAHALEFIEKLPEGFDSHIGENGGNLSGGQRQRLAIARAIYKNASIIILDEATSALDTESERHIQEALDALTQNRTTLVIAHRLSTIENADNIVVLEEGKIVEEGNHQSLLKHNGKYAQLHAIQFADD